MAKKVLSILCAIAMMVTMLSVGMVSVLAADNLGTVTRGEKSFGSLAWADSTYSAQEGYTYAGQKYYAFFNTEATGDAIMGRGQGVAVTLTNKDTVTLGDEFAFSFRYSYYQNPTYRLIPYANIAIGGMNIRVQTVEDETTNTAPTVAITYGDTSLSVKATSYVAYTAEEITAMFNAGKASQPGYYSPSATWTNESVVPQRYVDVNVRYANGTLTLNVSGATDSVAADIDITNATVAYTVGNDAYNVAAGLSNWEGSYFSEEYIEGDAGEGEEGGDDTVEYEDFGTFAFENSTYSETGANYTGAGQRYYSFFTTDYSGDTIMGRGNSISVTLTNNATATLGDDFEFSFRYSYRSVNSNNYWLVPYANVAVGDMNIRLQALADASSSADTAPTAVLTYGETTLTAKTSNYSTHSADNITAMVNAGKDNYKNTLQPTQYTSEWQVGDRYVDVTVKYQDGTLTLSVAGSGAAVIDSAEVALDMTDVAVAATVGNGSYQVAAGLSNWEGKYLPAAGEDPNAPNVESGTDLLDGATLEATGDTWGVAKNITTEADNKGIALALDTYALWSTHYGNVHTATSAGTYVFGNNFEVSAKLVVRNGSDNPTSASMAIGDVKLTYSRAVSDDVTIVLTDGSTTLGTYTTTVATLADGTQFENGNISLGEPNGTYTFKYDGTNLTVLFNGTAMTFNTGSTFAMDASKFSNVAFKAGVVSNGRTNFVYDCIYTNLTPIIDNDLEFYGASLILGNGIGMNFYVAPAVFNAYTDITATVRYADGEDEKTATYALEELDGYMGFTFGKYSPNMKDTLVYVSLTGTKAGKVSQGAEFQYSVANYISNMRKNDSENPELMGVIDAMEEYCEATAAYVAGTEYTYDGTERTPEYVLNTVAGGEYWTFEGCSLNLRETPTVLFAFATNENYYNYYFQVEINGRTRIIEAADFVDSGKILDDGSTVYYVYSRDITVTEMEDDVVGQMFLVENDEPASAEVTYSVGSYVTYQAQKTEKTVLYHLTQAMMAYGDAVKDYVTVE